MAPATARFYEAVVNGALEAVVNGALTHSGDSRLARHIGNAVLREDARGARLAKERKDSPRRIDAAVAAVMAHDPGRRAGGRPRAKHLHLFWPAAAISDLALNRGNAGLVSSP